MTPRPPSAVSAAPVQSNEQRYYDALKRIAKHYRSAESLLKRGEAGIEGVELLEMVYDNLQHEAAEAIRGRRRPK